MLARLVHKVKHLILCNFSLFFEFIGIAAKSSELAGTFNGEEFQFYSKFFDSAKKLIVLDIGANSGDWALKFMSNLGLKEIIIHAVEPIPDFAKQISQLNDPRIYLHNFAVGITSESLKIARVGGGGTSFPSFDEHYAQSDKNFAWHVVKVVAGDDVVEKMTQPPDLIKIDTDGYDFEVIKSLSKTLSLHRPIIQFEFTYRFAKSAGWSLEESINFLNGFNYKTYVLTSVGSIRKVKFPRLEVMNHQTKNFLSFPN